MHHAAERLHLAIQLDQINRWHAGLLLDPTRQMKKDKSRFMEAGVHRVEPFRCSHSARDSF